MLHGREFETSVLERLLSDARAGQSGVLVLRGEAGIGKTALLDYLVGAAAGCQVVEIAGVQSEMELPYAGLQQLVSQLPDKLGTLPEPQREAVLVAFGRASGQAPSRYLVNLATLSLLAAVGAEKPLVCIVDDSHWENLRTADPVWLVVALLLAQVGFLPEAASLRGAVRTPLPLQACVALKSALKFINLSVPGSAGSVAATVRFVQRQGGTSAEAVASGAIDDLAEKLVQLVMVLALLPVADVRVDTGGFHLGAPDSRLVLAIAAAVVVSVVLVAAVPPVREKVLPQLRSGIRALRVLRDRSKRLQLFGGNLLGELVFALALGAVCLGYGVSLTLPQLVLVNVGASVLASLIPVPGGVGAAEATLSAGLIACGVDESTAFAIAITHRLCTNYLPPLWGYFSLRWLRAGGFL